MEVRDECAHAVGCLIKCGVAHDDEEAIQSPISFWILAGVNSLLSGECCFLFFRLIFSEETRDVVQTSRQEEKRLRA